MKLFNSREDTEWYRINVFTKDWDTVPFALQGSQTVVNVKYQQTRWFDVYIRKRDIDRAEYVCSRSKLLEEDVTKPMFFSRICSKIK
jgi:1,2-phenylacetyl-CoA epoxidase PaaB subunit